MEYSSEFPKSNQLYPPPMASAQPTDHDTPPGRTEIKRVRGRKPYLAPRDSHIKTRVAEIAPTQCRCLIENRGNSEKPTIGIQLCHVYPRSKALDTGLLTSLEFFWGMDRDSLSLDSRKNCFYAVSDLHAMYDNACWCLLPKLETLKKYDVAMGRDRLEDDGGSHAQLKTALEEDDLEFHTYTFLALKPEMADRDITTYPTDRSQGGRFGKEEHYYPFDNPFLEIQSHLHPKFVILSLGRHLKHGTRISKEAREQEHVQRFGEELDLVEELHRRWTAKLTCDQENSKLFLTLAPEDQDKRASRTTADQKTYRPSGSTSTANLGRRRSLRTLKQQMKDRSPSRGRIGTTDKNWCRGTGSMSDSEKEDSDGEGDEGNTDDEGGDGDDNDDEEGDVGGFDQDDAGNAESSNAQSNGPWLKRSLNSTDLGSAPDPKTPSRPSKRVCM